MEIQYKLNFIPETAIIVGLYESSGLNRPIHDPERIQKMYDHSNLIITAWDGETLVGIARSLTDYCYCCYLSDLAVRKEYQKIGIGKKLIRLIREQIGAQTMLLLLAAPDAMDYYPQLNFEKVLNGFIIKRTK